MKRIISVSRRTDIPAFYGEWFMDRLKVGFAGYVNPFGGQKYVVSLKPEDVAAFVFWSKNFKPFIGNLEIIRALEYKFYFNYTITGLPGIFECNLAGKDEAIETLKELSRKYSPGHINWRYDPIVISDVTDYDFHIRNFKSLAASLEGYVKRCYFSFAVRYRKVKANLEKLKAEQGVKIVDPDNDFRIKLASDLAKIAHKHEIDMFTCCGDFLLSPEINKAHCIDGKLLEELFQAKFVHAEKPSRKECGCTGSIDIGAYDTCPHGCVYCYANMNTRMAIVRFHEHNDSSAFLGYAKAQGDKWVDVIEKGSKKLPGGTLSAGWKQTLLQAALSGLVLWWLLPVFSSQVLAVL